MVLLKFLFIIGLLITAVSCSDDKSNSPSTSTSEPTPTETSADAPAAPTPAAESDNDSPLYDTTPPPPANEKYLDTYTSVLIQEVRNQVANDPVTRDNKILNVEFANRILEINFTPGPHPKLSFTTHSSDAFKFELVNTNGNVQFFNVYKPAKTAIEKKSRSVLYTAEAKNVRTQKNKTLTIIKIKDVISNAVVHVFYITKSGTIKASHLPGYSYTRDLTKNSKIFLDNLIENNNVEGEFYGVITEQKNTSSASKFSLTVSDSFLLFGNYRADTQDRIPLSAHYKSAWKLFFGGSASYMVISDPSYRIESERDPVELNALNLDINVEAKEKIKGKSNTLPIKLFVQFK
ncbi:MAG: hypothetical protein V4596_11245 [Bdellovibrionota bacterium]